MSILTLKLILAPLIIGSASLAGRRWGPAVSGWLIGLPLTSGPVAFFVALSHGGDFAASTALGTLSGGLPLVAFALAYAWLALRLDWPLAILGSLLAYGALTVVMQDLLVLPLWPLFGLVLLAILLGIRLMPAAATVAADQSKPGPWDIPSRILLGTSFILLITGIAPFLGARLTGLLSTIPLYTLILTAFAHRLQGPGGAANVLRGLLFGLFGFAGFYIVLGLLIGWAGIGPSFAAASLTALLVQGASLLGLRQVKV